MVFSFFLWPPIPFGVSTGSRVCPFLGPYFFLLSLRDGYPTRSYSFDRH